MAEKKLKFNGKEYLPEEVPSELTFTLRKPVTIAGLTVESVLMQEPTVDECEKYAKELNASSNGVTANAKLISIIAARGNGDISDPFIKALGVRDFNDMNSYLNFFMTPGQ